MRTFDTSQSRRRTTDGPKSRIIPVKPLCVRLNDKTAALLDRIPRRKRSEFMQRVVARASQDELERRTRAAYQIRPDEPATFDPDEWTSHAEAMRVDTQQKLDTQRARGLCEEMRIDERMPWKEICERYPEQWVVMVDHNWDEDHTSEPKTARVLATGATRAEAKERARPLLAANDRWGCHFTGPIRGPVFGYRPWLLLP